MKNRVIEMESIIKTFPGVLANDHINFDAYKGETVSLLGENGAGKTTLMKMFYGPYIKDSGEIYVKGKKVDINSPKHAIDLGIGMVHQHFTLINSLTVVENVILSLPSKKLHLILTRQRKRSKNIWKDMNCMLTLKLKYGRYQLAKSKELKFSKCCLETQMF